MENEKTKIWLGEDGIVKLKIEKDISEEVIRELALEFKKITKDLPGKANVSIDVTTSIPISGVLFRRKIVGIVKDVFNDPGFNKVAEWGAKNNLGKTIILFIIGATKFKNFRYFDTEEEVLKWFKEV